MVARQMWLCSISLTLLRYHGSNSLRLSAGSRTTRSEEISMYFSTAPATLSSSKLPATDTTILPGVYLLCIYESSLSRSAALSESSLPIMGRPMGSSLKSSWVMMSWMSSSGVSSLIFISSKMTFLSLSISAASKTEFLKMSNRMSMALSVFEDRVLM